MLCMDHDDELLKCGLIYSVKKINVIRVGHDQGRRLMNAKPGRRVKTSSA